MSTQNIETVVLIPSENLAVIVEPLKQESSFFASLSGFFNNGSQTNGVSTSSIKSQEHCTWTEIAASQNKEQLKKNWCRKRQQWKDCDVKLADGITKFKQQYILTIGDIRIRSIMMAFTSALLYKAVSYNTTGLLRKSRNLGVSFAFMGYWFVPELFNPFLRSENLVKNIL